MQLKTNKTAKRWWVILIVCTFVLLWTAYAVSSRTLTGGELALFGALNNMPDDIRLIFFALTQLGSAWMLYAITLLALWNKRYRLALRLFVLGAVASIACEILKQLIGRPRPEELLAVMNLRDSVVVGKGFPSGHTALATVMALVLWAYIPARWRWLLVPAVLLVGLSRVYLGVHAPLDIIGGMAVGIMVFAASKLVTGKLSFVTKITGMKLR